MPDEQIRVRSTAERLKRIEQIQAYLKSIGAQSTLSAAIDFALHAALKDIERKTGKGGKK